MKNLNRILTPAKNSCSYVKSRLLIKSHKEIAHKLANSITDKIISFLQNTAPEIVQNRCGKIACGT